MEEAPGQTDDRAARLDLHRPDAYGRSFADVYDHWYQGVSDAEATARFVHDRCRHGPVLELGVGSGRLALPLTAMGLTVIGVDGSAEMLSRCPAAPSPGLLHLIRADMRALPVRGPVGVALIAFNTLFNLATEAEQQALLERLRALIGPDGVVVIEALNLTPLLTAPGESIGVRERAGDRVIVTATQLDEDRQTMVGQHLEITADGVSVRPWLVRWLSPHQLDRLADAAGLRLAERHGSWHEDPFTAASDTHVSVYRSH